MDYNFLLIIVFFIFLAFILLKRFKSKNASKDSSDDIIDFPYDQISHLFTPAERSFYGVLCQATKDQAIVFGKVRVADVLKTQTDLSAKDKRIAFNRISGKHFDYVLCKPDDLSIIATVELDDASHNTKKAIKRDEFLESACKEANLPLHRFKAKSSYKVAEVRDIIFSTLDLTTETSIISLSVEEVNKISLSTHEVSESSQIIDEAKTEEENQLCPKCSSELVLRTVKKGENKGNTFLACSAFPKCRHIAS